jgi:hypothetical protein
MHTKEKAGSFAGKAPTRAPGREEDPGVRPRASVEDLLGWAISAMEEPNDVRSGTRCGDARPEPDHRNHGGPQAARAGAREPDMDRGVAGSGCHSTRGGCTLAVGLHRAALPRTRRKFSIRPPRDLINRTNHDGSAVAALRARFMAGRMPGRVTARAFSSAQAPRSTRAGRRCCRFGGSW